MSTILDHPAAQELLDDATLSPAAVVSCRGRLTRFLQRYLPRFYRQEQRELATLVIEGRLSGLDRKTCEPIANQAGRPRKPVQHFVGCGKWDDEAVMTEMRSNVREALADPTAVLVLDPSAFPKKGEHSCGVKRQWCGRLGKEENCQVGVYLVYAAAGGCAPLDRRLYLPREWAKDKKRRRECHVPEEVKFQEKWRIGLDQLDRCAAGLPHGWVAADDEFGRVLAFRAGLRQRDERYVLDVPCNTQVRDLDDSAGAANHSLGDDCTGEDRAGTRHPRGHDGARERLAPAGSRGRGRGHRSRAASAIPPTSSAHDICRFMRPPGRPPGLQQSLSRAHPEGT